MHFLLHLAATDCSRLLSAAVSSWQLWLTTIDCQWWLTIVDSWQFVQQFRVLTCYMTCHFLTFLQLFTDHVFWWGQLITKFTSASIPWDGSEVHKKRFLVNLHHVISEAHFQKWCVAYAYAILDVVHVKLAAPSTEDVPCVDSKALNARIITFHPFYFSFCFMFPLSKFFKKVFCTMDCAPSQCTPNVYWRSCVMRIWVVSSSWIWQCESCFTYLKWGATRSMLRFVYQLQVVDGKARSTMVHLFPSPTMMVRHTL